MSMFSKIKAAVIGDTVSEAPQIGAKVNYFPIIDPPADKERHATTGVIKAVHGHAGRELVDVEFTNSTGAVSIAPHTPLLTADAIPDRGYCVLA